MSFCQKCGNELGDGQNFCPKCGTTFNQPSLVPVDSVIRVESKFDGDILSFIGWSILGGLITIFTLGICFPWALCMVYGWKINHTSINGKRLKFNGTAIGLFGLWIKWLLLCIITLGIYSFWIFISLEKWKVKHTNFAD